MTVKVIYRCDVCRDDMEPDYLRAVNFSNMKKFTLTDPRRHEGIHICYGCLGQIAEQYQPAWLAKKRSELVKAE